MSARQPVAPRPSKRALGEMLLGNQVQQAIYVATRLGIPDLLEAGPRDVEELARAAGADPDSLYRLLRTLASLGVFSEVGPKTFALTELASLLLDGPGSMRPYALWSGGVSYEAFGGLEHSVRTGEPAFERIFGAGFYEHLAAHRDVGELFDELMSRHTVPIAPFVAKYDYDSVETLVELGGGRGELLAAILMAHPAIRGVLVDKPQVLEEARGRLAEAGLASRCAVEAADVLDRVPAGGDAYLMKSLLHGMGDQEAGRVLDHCCDAMNMGGRVLIIEMILQPGNEPSPAKLMDLLMLVGCHGRERTAEEYATLLHRSGFQLHGIVPLKNGYSLIDGRAR